MNNSCQISCTISGNFNNPRTDMEEKKQAAIKNGATVSFDLKDAM